MSGSGDRPRPPDVISDLSSTDPDAVVIGAGPAGSIAALVMARRGLRVVMVDRMMFPRDKACGDLLVPNAWRILHSVGVSGVLDGALGIAQQRSVSAGDVDRHFLSAPVRPEREVRIIRRQVFDSRLVEAARDAGATLLHARVVGLDQQMGDRPVVTVHAHSDDPDQSQLVQLEPEFVVGADGAMSKVAQLIGARKEVPDSQAFALRCYAHASAATLSEILEFIVDLEAFGIHPEAYGWIFPVSSTVANVGVCQWGRNAGKGAAFALEELFDVLPKIRPDVPILIPASRPFGGYIRFDAPTVRRVVDRAVLVGDAAGLAQPDTGEGISFALRSGMLAGHAIIGAHRGTGNLDEYDRAVSQELLPGLMDGLVRLHEGETVASSGLPVRRTVTEEAGVAAGEHDGASGVELFHRSTGVLIGQLGGRIIAVDTVRAVVHMIDGDAGWLLMFDEPTSVADAVDEMVEYTDRPAALVRSGIETSINWLRERHLIDRRAPLEKQRSWHGSRCVVYDAHVGLTHSVLDARVAFRSHDPSLVEALDGLFTGGVTGVAPTIWIDVEPDDDGGCVVTAADEWRFTTKQECLERIVGIVDGYAARTLDLAVIRAGAVRTPSGQVWVIAGEDDESDRSMLIASLIQVGCDYLSDKYVGIRSDTLDVVAYPAPLNLDPDGALALLGQRGESSFVSVDAIRTDAEVLGGDHGPIAGLLFIDHQPDRPAATEHLSSEDVLQLLLTSTPDIARAGDNGLQALCNVAENTFAVRVTHHDVRALAHILTDEGRVPLGDDLDRALRDSRRSLNDGFAVAPLYTDTTEIVVRRSGEVDWTVIEADGERAVVLRGPAGPAHGLTGTARDLWLHLGSEPTFEHLVRVIADAQGGADRLAARDVAWLLDQFVEYGLASVVGGDPHMRQLLSLVTEMAAEGPTEAARASIVRARGVPPLKAGSREVEWHDWASIAATFDVGGVVVVTDHPRATAMLDDITGATELRALPADIRDYDLIELRELPGPGNGAVIRTGSRIVWFPSDAVLSGLALSICASLDEADAVLLGTLSSIPARGIWIDEQGRLYVDDHRRALGWLIGGGTRERASWCRVPADGISIVLDDQLDELVMWVEAIELSASRTGDGPVPLLRLLATRATMSSWKRGEDGTVLVRFDQVTRPESSKTVTARDDGMTGGRLVPTFAVLHGGDATGEQHHPRTRVSEWAAQLGGVTYGNVSAKISADGVVVGRPLIAVDLPDGEQGLLPSNDPRIQRVHDAFLEIGMPPDLVAEAAPMATSTGSFMVGEQHDGSNVWRRKLYVNQPSREAWQPLRRTWPDDLIVGQSVPEWVAWKWDNASASSAERSVEYGHLAGSETVEEVVGPTLDRMGDEWTEAVRSVLAPLHLTSSTKPVRDDCLTIDEGGRCTVDLTIRGRNRHVILGDLEPELRWLTAVAGHERAAADELVAWARTGRLSVLIFGMDGADRPFVNLYISQP